MKFTIKQLRQLKASTNQHFQAGIYGYKAIKTKLGWKWAKYYRKKISKRIKNVERQL
jgi:hypothetical protein